MNQAIPFVFGALATLALATPANAVTFVTLPGAPDPGPAPLETLVVTFDAANAPGFVWSAGTIASRIGLLSGVAAPPAGNTTRFGYVSPANGNNFATLSTPKLRSISFVWGSVDSYNSLDVLDANGNVLRTIAGTELPQSTGNQFVPSTNPRVFITAAEGQWIGGLTFRSTSPAFEFDDIAARAFVPEPASWAMLIAGFGLVGAAARRRRASVLA